MENLFKRLPVRRRDLEKNIKREYGKVLGLLHAYACVSTGVRFSVKNQMPKGKSVLVFSTKSNPTTRENISNIYGAKTLLALIPLELELEIEPSAAAKKFGTRKDRSTNKILIHGHISKPIFGEGRQTPDRQMFFVNSRPCGLPQIAKAFNEVYRSFNISQSPFVFANFEMDTASYDVNVSPDKRTILIHDAAAMIESLKASLTELFEKQDQTVPQSQLFTPRQSTVKQSFSSGARASSFLEGSRRESGEDSISAPQDAAEIESKDNNESLQPSRRSMQSVLQKFNDRSKTPAPTSGIALETGSPTRHRTMTISSIPETSPIPEISTPLNGFEQRPQELEEPTPSPEEAPIPSIQQQPALKTPGVVQNAFDRMRPKRTPPDVATITIGGKTVTSMIGGIKRSHETAGLTTSMSRPKRRVHTPSVNNRLSQSIRSFAAPATQSQKSQHDDDEVDEEEGDEPGYGPQTHESDMESAGDASEHESVGNDQGISDEDEGQGSDSDESYVDEREQKAREEARVRELIRAAEETVEPSEKNVERAKKVLKRSRGKDCTYDLMCSIDGSLARIRAQIDGLRQGLRMSPEGNDQDAEADNDQLTQEDSAKAKLSLTVSKDDFSKMRIIGQFNLGFILATRSGKDIDNEKSSKDELFIIDQHASDEKYNFERLQAETVVQNQRLVRPKTLDLTAVEEEVILDNISVLEKNGFIVEVDTSGDEPIGRRCKLLSLPLSKEVVFNTRDLEELVALLSETPHSTAASARLSNGRYIPRPSKVRKMFAMRACRSSIMVGKTLTQKQMERVVRHMGMIDKPWNCPHGRPTMRHLMTLGQWKEWDEWEPHCEFDSTDTDSEGGAGGSNVWKQFLEQYGDSGKD